MTHQKIAIFKYQKFFAIGCGKIFAIYLSSACEIFCTHSSEVVGIFVQLPADICVQTAAVQKSEISAHFHPCTCAGVEIDVAKKYW